MEFTIHSKLADIIHRNYLLLPVLNRFDIQLGFGDRTVEQLCMEKGIHTDFFLVMINSFHDHDYFPQERLLSFPLELILEYTRKSHRFYLDFKVPQIENMIQQLSESADAPLRKHFILIEKFFAQYKAELIEHIQEEENNIYPYITTIDKAVNRGTITPQHVVLIEKNPIKTYADRHDNVEDKLYDLKNLIIKYLPPSQNNTLSNSLLVELFRLERDLNDHARMEDKVLFPMVQKIENQIRKNVL